MKMKNGLKRIAFHEMEHIQICKRSRKGLIITFEIRYSNVIWYSNAIRYSNIIRTSECNIRYSFEYHFCHSLTALVCDDVRVGVWECVWVRINISGRYNCITMWYESCMCSGKCRVWWAKDWPTLAMRVPNLYILLCWVDPGTQVLEVAHLLNCIAFGCPERWVIREDILCDDLTLLSVRHEPKHGIFLLHSFQEFLGFPHWVDIRQISST